VFGRSSATEQGDHDRDNDVVTSGGRSGDNWQGGLSVDKNSLEFSQYGVEGGKDEEEEESDSDDDDDDDGDDDEAVVEDGVGIPKWLSAISVMGTSVSQFGNQHMRLNVWKTRRTIVAF